MHERQLKRQREIPKGGLKIIEDLAARGARHIDVAMALQMSASTWARVRQTNSKANDAWERGRGRLRLLLIGALMQPPPGKGAQVSERTSSQGLAHRGACLLWNNLFGPDVQQAPAGQTMQVLINLPAPAHPEAYRAQLITQPLTHTKEPTDADL